MLRWLAAFLPTLVCMLLPNCKLQGRRKVMVSLDDSEASKQALEVRRR